MKTLRHLALSFLALPAFAAESITESAREIPVAYEVDVVVAGSTVGAVSAAIEAANQGAKVFLAGPRPYLGEDVAGTLKLWLEEGEVPENALEREIFERSATPHAFANALPFTYTTDVKASSKHPDHKLTGLRDGQYTDATSQSVQYDADVTIVADLGRVARVKELHLLGFHRSEDFELGDVQVWTSPNGKLWRDLGLLAPEPLTGWGDRQTRLSREIKQPSRYVKLLVKRKPGLERVLLGELIITEDGVKAAVATKQIQQPPTPMQVKIALDQALINAGVTFLYNCPVTEVLQDAAGNPAGIVVANRAGRQAITGKVLIDGTMRSHVAELAGAKIMRESSGSQPFERVVIGGEPQGAVREVGVSFNAKEGPQPIYVHQLEIPLKDHSWASLAEAENLARDKTFDVGVYDEADTIYAQPGKASLSGNVAGLYVLGVAAGNDPRPLAQMRLGTAIGAKAAKHAAASPAPTGIQVAGKNTTGQNLGEIQEFLNGARPTHQADKTIPSPERTLPILGSYDVVVVGGGTGGAPAAIGAARKGAKTLLIEFQDHLGGVGTLGLISTYYHGYRKGFTSEVDEAVVAMGGPKRKGGWNPVAKREWWRSAIRKAGGEIWFSTLGCGAVMKGNDVAGVVVATPTGRGVVLAKTVIDSTGNSDIAAAAGAETLTTSAEHVAMQGTGLSPKALGTGYTNTDYSFSDESDPVDQWRMIVSARKKYKNQYDLSTFIDSRERRRIIGEAFITPLDIINDRTYEDTISLHASNFDTHGYTVHPIFLINFPDKKGMVARVPYRSMLPQKIENVLVTGLSTSAHRDSMPILRMQACIQNQGYAAGVASATAVAEGKTVRTIDIKPLQQHLVEIGSLPENEVGTPDSDMPDDAAVEAAVQTVVKDYKGLAVLLQRKELARDLLRKAYTATEPSDRKLIYANILGMLGDDTGAATLAKTINDQEWDAGWNFRGMGQFGGSISRLDSHIIALGRSGAKNQMDTLLKKVATLDASKEFSHHRSVGMALEELGDPAAAPALAALLQKPDMRGYHIHEVTPETNPATQEQRSQPLRELILARALYRCGDHEGIGKAILRAYEQDLRGLFAKHAQAVLNETGDVERVETGL